MIATSRKLTVRDVVVTVDDVDLIEKNTTRSVNVTVSGAGGGITTRIRISTVSGTGSATFDDGSVEKVIMGDTVPGSPVVLTIKGVTESSTVNNLELRATIDWLSTPKKIDPFSVATITALAFERINTTGTGNVPDVALDNNPGNGQPNTNVGQRIFPDKNWPDDTTDRATLRVRATVTPANVPNLRVYFASFDLDDPSADAAPIDTNGANGVDNNGNVSFSKSGVFSSAAGVVCGKATAGTPSLFISVIDCPVAGNTTAANFKVTKQPGDNFSIAASLDRAYRDGVRVDTNAGTFLKDAGGQIIPISGQPNPNNVRGIRTNMLTVWRKIHIEIDEMGNVGTGNNITGTINGAVTIPAGGVSDVKISTTGEFDKDRYYLGRLVVGGNFFIVNSNFTTGTDPNLVKTLNVVSPFTALVTIPDGANFVLYEDDDFNEDDITINNDAVLTMHKGDGDSNEDVVQMPNTLKYLQASDGVHPDGKLKNVYSSAYIMPEYEWARPFNNSDTTFELNVESGIDNNNYGAVLNENRGTGGSERDGFWIAYFLIAYQGPDTDDLDGVNSGGGSENPLLGITFGQTSSEELGNCDCFNSVSCPTTRKACVLPNGNIVFPRGEIGNFIFQETIQDLKRFFMIAPLEIRRTTEEISLTPPHELGHQFGLLGDVKNTPQINIVFGLMDTSDYVNNRVNNFEFHPEHINILRKRVKSPGE